MLLGNDEYFHKRLAFTTMKISFPEHDLDCSITPNNMNLTRYIVVNAIGLHSRYKLSTRSERQRAHREHSNIASLNILQT